MPDLFELMPELSRVSHRLLADKRVVLVGVSTIRHDDRAFYFEVTRPRYWSQGPSDCRVVGIGGIGGRLEPGETVLACLHREVREELGVRIRAEGAGRMALIHGGEVAAWLDLPSSRDHPAPYMLNLLPPQLPREDRPDHLAIVTFLGELEGTPHRGDLFGLLSIERSALKPFFQRPEWPLEEAVAFPGLAFDLASELPAGCLLRPTLTARAFQVLLQGEAEP